LGVRFSLSGCLVLGPQFLLKKGFPRGARPLGRVFGGQKFFPPMLRKIFPLDLPLLCFPWIGAEEILQFQTPLLWARFHLQFSTPHLALVVPFELHVPEGFFLLLALAETQSFLWYQEPFDFFLFVGAVPPRWLAEARVHSFLLCFLFLGSRRSGELGRTSVILPQPSHFACEDWGFWAMGCFVVRLSGTPRLSAFQGAAVHFCPPPLTPIQVRVKQLLRCRPSGGGNGFTFPAAFSKQVFFA